MEQGDKKWRWNWSGWYYGESTFSKVWRLLSINEKFDCWKKEIFHKKSTARWNNRRIHHTIEELIIYMRIWRCQRRINLVQTGWWNTKQQDTRYILRKGADLTLKKVIDVCRADETTNHEMKIIKQEIDVDAVQKTRRRSNDDNRGKMQHQQQRTTRRNANTVESYTCRSNVQHLVKHAESVGKGITGRIFAMQE